MRPFGVVSNSVASALSIAVTMFSSATPAAAISMTFSLRIAAGGFDTLLLAIDADAGLAVVGPLIHASYCFRLFSTLCTGVPAEARRLELPPRDILRIASSTSVAL